MNSIEEKIDFAPFIIGTMRLGEWGSKMDSSELEYFIDGCVDMGLIDFDHADIYGCYTAEGEFGAVLKRRPDLRQKIRNTTKCGIKLVCETRPGHKIKSYDSSAKHIIQSTENSLHELGVEAIDLLLLHRPDYLMNPQEIAEAFSILKQAGKVKRFGASNFTPAQFAMLSEFTPLVNHQVEISVLHRQTFEDGTLDQCLQFGIVPTAWSPFGGGAVFSNDLSKDPQITEIRKVVEKLGNRHSAKADQILLAFLRKHPAGIVSVLGTSKISRIQSAFESLKVELTHEEWYEIFRAAAGAEVP